MERRTFLGAALAAGALAQALGQAGPALAAGSVSLPFDFDQYRRIMVPIQIDGKPAWAWLDSGASVSVVDLTFAHALGMAIGDKIQAAGVSSQVKGARLVTAELRIGAALLQRHPLVVIDLAEVSEQSPRPVQVILGRDLFDAAVLDIDFAGRRMSITLAQAFRPPPGTPLPLGQASGLRTLPINLDGVMTPAVFDLGNTGALIVDHVFAETHGLMKGRRISTQVGIGADGPHEDAVLTLERVELGGVRFHDVPAVAARRLTADAPANVGLDLLSRFHLTVDFVGDRLWLQPYPDAGRAQFRKNRAGLFVRPDVDRLLVTHVATGSPAAQAGWRPGEIITAIDGKPIEADFAAGPLSHWSAGPAGEVVALTMADGTTRRLTLADYY